MAKDKDKSINPAAAARKAEKAKALKKGKAAVAQQRNDRLAKQNPHRIQAQIDDLKALEANHTINPREKKQLDDLERELARVIKAKEASGEKYVPRTQQTNTQGGVLGKRARGEEQANRRKKQYSPESSDTDPDVGDIPMPRDTPPPLPRRTRDEGKKADDERQAHALPDKPEAAPSQAVYESKPVMRDLRKEAAAFVPAAVRKKQAEGGGNTASVVESKGFTEELQHDSHEDQKGNPPKQNTEVDDDLKRLQEEEEQWRKETKQVTMEEVEDEDA